jgi:CheY-like chemotaxis protein
MKTKINCILLVDDNPDDNFYHERVIKKNIHPDLILLDINMPGMNGWEFLEEYNKLEKQFQSHAIVVMLTTSGNPDDKMKAKLFSSVSDFKTKPLTKEMLEDIIVKYFN